MQPRKGTSKWTLEGEPGTIAGPLAVSAKGAGVRRNRSGRITLTKILDAAEQVFAEKGIHAASLREIMIEAEVNIAAVNYYFGSKAHLLKAVVQRRSSVLNGARLTLLDQAARQNGGTPSVEGWVNAFIEPFVDAESSNDPGWRRFMQVVNWVATAQSNDKLCHEIIQETYGDMRENFLEALKAALPQLREEEIHWRYHCAVTVMRYCVLAREHSAAVSDGTIDSKDVRRIKDHIVPFLHGGLTAPPRPFG